MWIVTVSDSQTTAWECWRLIISQDFLPLMRGGKCACLNNPPPCYGFTNSTTWPFQCMQTTCVQLVHPDVSFYPTPDPLISFPLPLCCYCIPLSFLLLDFHNPLSCVQKTPKIGTKQTHIPSEVKKNHTTHHSTGRFAPLPDQRSPHPLFLSVESQEILPAPQPSFHTRAQSAVPIPAAHDRHPSISQLECTVQGGWTFKEAVNAPLFLMFAPPRVPWSHTVSTCELPLYSRPYPLPKSVPAPQTFTTHKHTPFDTPNK